jgi:hypothetical protein
MQRMKPNPTLDMNHWIERRAKLFEAGEYPDKGIAVSPAQVAALAATFHSPVPVWIEHAESPLELGYLTAVAADGDELFGTLMFSPEAHALLEKSAAKSLSVGLAPDLSAIREVSLVRNPRVASAQIFSSESIRFDREFAATIDYRAAYEALCAQNQARESEAELRQWMQQGRLTPAQLPFARALHTALSRQPNYLEFNGESIPAAHLLSELIRNSPARPLTESIAKPPVFNSPDSDDALMLPEEAAFYRRHFPDIQLREIAARR